MCIIGINYEKSRTASFFSILSRKRKVSNMAPNQVFLAFEIIYLRVFHCVKKLLRVTRHQNPKPKATVLHQQSVTPSQVSSKPDAAMYLKLHKIIARYPALQYTSHDVDIIRRQARAQAENSQETADFRSGLTHFD